MPKSWGRFALLVGAAVLLASRAYAAEPELPRVFVDTTLTAPTGTIRTVAAGGNLQASLDAAVPGDVIELQAGATFSGNFRLRNKPGAQWITIRSSAHQNLPAGTRVGPADAVRMAKITSPNNDPPIAAEFGAHHYRFIGIEITTNNATTQYTAYSLVAFGYDPLGYEAASESQLQHHMIFDRCYLHGTPTGNVRRAITLNSTHTAVIDSYLSDFHEVGADSQALVGWNGPGPFKLENNTFEGAGENVMFGGATPKISGLIPSDIEIRGNHFRKPLTWKIGDPSYAGTPWSVKNLFELKNAQRVLVDGNVFENSWAHSQSGNAILFTPKTQDCAASWAVVNDVRFTRNVVRHAAEGLRLEGTAADCPQAGPAASRILVADNLWEDIGGAPWSDYGNGFLFIVANQSRDVTIDHNTALHKGTALVSDVAPSSGFVYRNNLSAHNAYGVHGSGRGVGTDTINYYFPGASFAMNVIAGPWPSSAGATVSMYYGHPGNYFPDSLADARFTDAASHNYRLVATSPFKNAASDAKDVGADFDQLEAATAGVVTGEGSVPPPPPPPSPTDTTPPAVAITSPAGTTQVSGRVTVSTTFSDNVQVTMNQFSIDGAIVAGFSPPRASYDWDSSGVGSGNHSVTVTAIDGAGNRASDTEQVYVNQVDATPPTVSITSPSDGTRVNSRMRAKFRVTDDVKVKQVEALIDGATARKWLVGALSGDFSFLSDALSRGWHTLTVRATDNAGKTTERSVTVVR